jgi:hypothetical protein
MYRGACSDKHLHQNWSYQILLSGIVLGCVCVGGGVTSKINVFHYRSDVGLGTTGQRGTNISTIKNISRIAWTVPLISLQYRYSNLMIYICNSICREPGFEVTCSEKSLTMHDSWYIRSLKIQFTAIIFLTYTQQNI